MSVTQKGVSPTFKLILDNIIMCKIIKSSSWSDNENILWEELVRFWWFNIAILSWMVRNSVVDHLKAIFGSRQIFHFISHLLLFNCMLLSLFLTYFYLFYFFPLYISAWLHDFRNWMPNGFHCLVSLWTREKLLSDLWSSLMYDLN